MSDARPTDEPWNPLRRFAFRLGAAYFVAYALLNGNASTLPLALFSTNGEPPEAWLRVTGRVGSVVGHALGLGEVRAHDNSDSVGDHVAYGCLLLLALVAAIVWSLFARGAKHHERELAWLSVAVRYVLASTLFAYAVFKVFPAQFSEPQPTRLLTPYGQLRRMEILWGFMGVSPGYQMFAGWVETLACSLVLSRRTATLGAILVLGAVGNIFVMDLCFGVSAKVCALHMILMAGFILAMDLRRVVDVFILRRSVPSARIQTSRRRLALKAIVITTVGLYQALPVRRFYLTNRDGAPVPPLYGAFDVEEMRRDGQIVAPLLTDETYWRHLAVDRRGATVFLGDGSRVRFSLSFDPRSDTGALTRASTSLEVARAGSGLTVDGTLDGRRTEVRLRPTDPRNLRLLGDDVHWFVGAQ